MAIEVCKNLFVGNLKDCQTSNNLSIIHACKDPCHKNGVGYIGNLASSHPNYLIKETENDLYLNLVDMSRISPKFTDNSMKKAIEFIENHLNQNNKVLIHCNLGQSRSPSIAILYLAKNSIINNSSFENALIEFKGLYSNINLGIGFYNYLKNNWNNLIKNGN